MIKGPCFHIAGVECDNCRITPQPYQQQNPFRDQVQEATAIARIEGMLMGMSEIIKLRLDSIENSLDLLVTKQKRKKVVRK